MFSPRFSHYFRDHVWSFGTRATVHLIFAFRVSRLALVGRWTNSSQTRSIHEVIPRSSATGMGENLRVQASPCPQRVWSVHLKYELSSHSLPHNYLSIEQIVYLHEQGHSRSLTQCGSAQSTNHSFFLHALFLRISWTPRNTFNHRSTPFHSSQDLPTTTISSTSSPSLHPVQPGHLGRDQKREDSSPAHPHSSHAFLPWPDRAIEHFAFYVFYTLTPEHDAIPSPLPVR